MNARQNERTAIDKVLHIVLRGIGKQQFDLLPKLEKNEPKTKNNLRNLEKKRKNPLKSSEDLEKRGYSGPLDQKDFLSEEGKRFEGSFHLLYGREAPRMIKLFFLFLVILLLYSLLIAERVGP